MFLSDWLNWLPDLFEGLLAASGVTIIATIIGLPIGALLGIGAAANLRLCRWICTVIVEVGRGIPALVFLLLVYYGIAQFGVTLTSFVAATAGLALTTAVYSSELFRAGFEAVPRGEVEAAKALGMSRFYTQIDVIVPQGLRIATPSLVGLVIQMFQATALAYQIALSEILSRAYDIGAQTFQYLSVLALAGLVYLLITLPLSYLAQHLGGGEKSRKPRRKKARGDVIPLTTTNPVIPGEFVK